MNGQGQDEILSTLQEILKWIRVQAAPAAKKTLESTLTRPEYRSLYQSLDGTKTQKEIGQATGLSQARISQLVNAWKRAGIVDEMSPGKFVRSFDLEELGIDIGASGG